MHATQMNTFTIDEKVQLFDVTYHYLVNCDGGRGIYKRIDETRELLDFLKENTPDLFKRAPFIETWIAQQDAFLNMLVAIVQPTMDPGFVVCRFPRPWLWDNYNQKLFDMVYGHYEHILAKNHSRDDGGI